jgi:hypothetical protein
MAESRKHKSSQFMLDMQWIFKQFDGYIERA